MLMAAWQWVENTHNLSWSQRITYLVLVLATVVNLRNAFESSIDPPWRRMYAYKGSVALVAWVYYSLLILGVIGIKDFVFVSRWIQPLIVFGLCTSALLHRWELNSLRKKKELEERLDKALNGRDEEDV